MTYTHIQSEIQSPVSIGDIRLELDRHLDDRNPNEAGANVLLKLLAHVEPVDFRAHAMEGYQELAKRHKELTQEVYQPDGNVDSAKEKELAELKQIEKKIDEFKLRHKHYLVIAIDQLLEMAAEKNWNLCRRHDFYYCYNGMYWENIHHDDMKDFLGRVAARMGVPKFDSRYFEFRDKLFKQFEMQAHLPAPVIPVDTVLINLQNGTFEISPEKQDLREFRHEDFLTYQLPFKYDPGATAPLFQKYLNEVLPDLERQNILAEFLGYVFTRNLKLEVVLFLYGSGRNGKGVIFEIIKALLGTENISHYSLANVTDSSGYYRAKLMNKLVNWASDVGDHLQSDIFKQLASGEPVDARLPYKEPFQLENVCKFIFNTNTLPTKVEHTYAFFERFLIIPFEEYIKPENRDPKLPAKIIEKELPGVFNWIMTGLRRLLKQNRISRCAASEKILNQFRKESDSVALFCEDRKAKPSKTDYVLSKNLYFDYRSYCVDEGLKPLARKNFHSRLEDLDYPIERKTAGKVVYMSREVMI